jgi:hypothetical protein
MAGHKTRHIIFYFETFYENDFFIQFRINNIIEFMTRRILLPLVLSIFISIPLFGQSDDIERIKEYVQESDVKMHVYFLAADEFKGRDTGTPQLDIAGRYISTWFMTNGVNPLPGYDYFQTIPFEKISAPDGGEMVLGDSTFIYGRDFIIMNTPRGEFSGPLKVLEYGMEEELADLNLEGNIVITKAGAEGQMNPQQWFMNSQQKNQVLKERGAAAVIELYDSSQLPWQILVRYLNQDRLEIAENEDTEEDQPLPHLWMNSTGADHHSIFSDMESVDATITVTGEPVQTVHSHNVVGYIEGSDPEKKDEYLLLGAHYDHVGIVTGQTEGNYINNGARDNAVGTSGIMLAARYFADNPPKRSVIFAAWTAEEIGLLGSNYFSENPMVPLDQIVYKLNIDGAGYNDTTKVTVIGLGRTEADDDLKAAASAFGLEAIPDPVPEQNLFDRSDNVNFARQGIPAPTYSLGLTAFDEEINRYYHTVDDEPDTINYPYVTSYIRSFLLAAEKVANRDQAPFWIEGDVYEEAGRELYGLD